MPSNPLSPSRGLWRREALMVIASILAIYLSISLGPAGFKPGLALKVLWVKLRGEIPE